MLSLMKALFIKFSCHTQVVDQNILINFQSQKLQMSETSTNAPLTGENSTDVPPIMRDEPCSCTENQVCLRVGRFGEHKYVDCKFQLQPKQLLQCMYHEKNNYECWVARH